MRTAIFDLNDDLAARIRALPRRSVVGLYWACADVCRVKYDEWLAEYERNGWLNELMREEAALLTECLDATHAFALTGKLHHDAAALRERLLSVAEEIGQVDDGDAQATPICAHIALQAALDPAYDAGEGVWYALELAIAYAGRELFGSGVRQGDWTQDAAISAHPYVVAASDFFVWATSFLADGNPNNDDVRFVRSRAHVLVAPSLS